MARRRAANDPESLAQSIERLGTGAVGLLRAIKVLETGRVPAQINYETPNAELAREGSPFFVPTVEIPLPELPVSATPSCTCWAASSWRSR